MNRQIFTNKNGHLMVALSKSEISFLNGYAPKDRHMTSPKEISKITDKLSLKECSSEELTAIRNAVVSLYSTEIEHNGDDSALRWKLMSSMMSVTAVIDTFIYGK